MRLFPTVPDGTFEFCVFDGTIPSMSTGYLMSTNFPDNYDNSLDCTIKVDAASGGVMLHLYVLAFYTERGYDFLFVNTSSELYRYHGDGSNPDSQDAMIIGENYTCKWIGKCACV